MESIYASISLLSSIFFFQFLPNLASAQICQKTFGNEILLYRLTCNQQKLTFTTHTGSYLVNSIDYNRQVIYISDPTRSYCFGTVPSKFFGLDWDSPFMFDERTIFALLGCSTNSSCIHSSKLLCDQGICGLLNSCRHVNTFSINLPSSTCCVHTLVNIGPSFEMDLQKLQCSSYSWFYNFNAEQSDAYKRKYGIALKYKFSVKDDYPSSCVACERSNGVCGYNNRDLKSFICNCPSGINTNTDCFFEPYYDVGRFRNGMQLYLPFVPNMSIA